MRGYKQKIAVVPGAAAGGGRGLFGGRGWGGGGVHLWAARGFFGHTFFLCGFQISHNEEGDS